MGDIRFSDIVKFEPWGKNHQKGFRGRTLLILGDSHYCAKNENRNAQCLKFGDCSYNCMNATCYSMTNGLIRDEYLPFRKGEKPSAGYLQTILAFEKNLFGYTPSIEESIDFWNGVIFYNYIQHSQIKPQTRRKTLPDEIAGYQLAFKEVLEKCNPDIIIVWSKFLFTKDWLPNGVENIPDYTLTAEVDNNLYHTPIRTFALNGKYVRAIITQHPCCRYGKDQTKWHALLKKFLELDD